MAHQRDISRDPFTSDVLPDRGYALGRLLSQIFHPIVLNITTFVIVGSFALDNYRIGLKWAGICILLLVLQPTLFFLVRLRQGAYGDEDISVRQQRNELYLFGLGWVLVATITLVLMGAPRPFVAVMVCALTMGLFGSVVNLFWKISVHSASIATTATVALLYLRTLGIVLWLLALAVGWARVRTGNHTPLQVLAGFGSAAAIVLLVFQVVGASG